MKRCSKCGRVLPASGFYKNPHIADGLSGWCKDCQSEYSRKRWKRDKEKISAQHREYYIKHRDEANERAAKWRKKHPGRVREVMRKSIHGVTPERFESMFLAQKGRCAICREALVNPNIDHCHNTGRIRGLLCRGCNLGLGNFKDSIDLLRLAAKYLTKTKQQNNRK